MNGLLIPVAVVEDLPSSINRLQLMLEKVQERISMSHGKTIKLKLELAGDYSKGFSLLSQGCHPLAIIDLGVPDPMNEVITPNSHARFPGLSLIDAARDANKDILIAAYTGFATEAFEELIGQKVDGLLNKVGENVDEKKNIPKLIQLIGKVLERFNYFIDVQTDEACALAFGFDQKWRDFKPSYEICLRRLLSQIHVPVHYDVIGQGRSGAGVVSAHFKEHYPLVMKLGSYSELAREVKNYELFIKNRVAEHAKTDPDSLSQAGAVGVIAYSFEGDIASPQTLGNIIRDSQVPIENIEDAISRHFCENCKLWYSTSDEIPYDLASECENYYFESSPSNTAVNIFDHVPKKALTYAVTYANEHIENSKINSQKLVKMIIEAVKQKRRKIQCRMPSIAHGDLNVDNLIWNDKHNCLSMIDFAKTRDNASRMLDFTKLEASIKYHIPLEVDAHSDIDDKIRSCIVWEKELIAGIDAWNQQPIPSYRDPSLSRKARAISAVRKSALQQCGPRGKDEYSLALFLVTAKHITYSAKDFLRAQSMHDKKQEYCALIALVHALFSAVSLSLKITGLIK